MTCAMHSPQWFAARDARRGALLTGGAGQGARLSPGLVISINNVNTFGTEPIQIDRLQARCTRLRKNLGIAAKWHSQSGYQAWMLTLTYRDGVAWEPSHVREALQRLRVWLKRAHSVALRYVWVMETKARKSGLEVGQIKPHMHVVVWVPHQVTADELKLDDRGYWQHGMTNAVKAVAAVRYIMKYASKFDNEGAFPKGARCYGVGGLDAVGGSVRRWINWPSFVQARAAITDSYGPAAGGGWVNRVTGEWFGSEWGLSLCTARHTVLRRIRCHERVIPDVAGPYSWASASVAVH